MAKNVYRGGEFAVRQHKVYLKPPEAVARVARGEAVAELVPLEEAEEYTGPSADDLRREAEAFKEQWDAEREEMIAAARAEADRILKEAEEEAFRSIREKTESAAEERRQADEDAQRIRAEAEAERERVLAEAAAEGERLKAEAVTRGHAEGVERGLEAGKAEIKRVIDRFHIVLNKAIERRNEIIAESETQVVNLVLAIGKKVVKVISENQKNVVVNNIVQALQKLQQKSDVIVRVNLSDLELASRYKEDILAMAERVTSITIAEDSSVDPGGCIIETDFGEIDARIASQLREIEDRIVELVPVRSRPRAQRQG